MDYHGTPALIERLNTLPSDMTRFVDHRGAVTLSKQVPLGALAFDSVTFDGGAVLRRDGNQLIIRPQTPAMDLVPVLRYPYLWQNTEFGVIGLTHTYEMKRLAPAYVLLTREPLSRLASQSFVSAATSQRFSTPFLSGVYPRALNWKTLN